MKGLIITILSIPMMKKKEIIEEARIVLDEIRRGVRIEKGFEYLKE